MADFSHADAFDKALFPGMLLTAAGALGLLGYAFDRSRHLYDGPVDVPGVARMEMLQNYRVDGPVGAPLADGVPCSNGLTVTLTLNSGSDIRVRDYNGNFRVDGEDVVRGDIPSDLSLDQTLDQLQRYVR